MQDNVLFAELILNNPDLPVIPLVSSEYESIFFNEDFVRAAGEIKAPFISKYTYIREADNSLRMVLENEVSNKNAKSYVWKLAIFVYINPMLQFGS